MADEDNDDEDFSEIDSMLDPDAEPNYAAGGGVAAVFLGLVTTIIVLLVSGGGAPAEYAAEDGEDGAAPAEAAYSGVDPEALDPAPAIWSLPRGLAGETGSRSCEGVGVVLVDGRTQLCVEFDAAVTHPDLLPLSVTGPQLEAPLQSALAAEVAPRIRAMRREDLLGPDGPERVRLVLLEEINAAIAPFYFDEILIHRFEVT